MDYFGLFTFPDSHDRWWPDNRGSTVMYTTHVVRAYILFGNLGALLPKPRVLLVSTFSVLLPPLAGEYRALLR